MLGNPWKSSYVERKAIGQRYTRRAKIPIFASMTVLNFTVLPEPQKKRYWTEILQVDFYHHMKQVIMVVLI